MLAAGTEPPQANGVTRLRLYNTATLVAERHAVSGVGHELQNIAHEGSAAAA